VPYDQRVSYRDDLDAAHARADALERELAELRARDAGSARDEQALADERRRGLLERATLREQLEQARRDAAQAQLLAEQAQAEAALAPASPRALSARQRVQANLWVGAISGAICAIAAAVTSQAMTALLALGVLASCSIALIARKRPRA